MTIVTHPCCRVCGEPLIGSIRLMGICVECISESKNRPQNIPDVGYAFSTKPRSDKKPDN